MYFTKTFIGPVRVEHDAYSGVHPPKPMMHSPPLFQISFLFSEYFRVWEKFSHCSQKCMFHPRHFLITFLVIDYEFRIFPPIFAKTLHFPLFWENVLFPPLHF